MSDTSKQQNAHVYVVLDRSGSMEAIRTDVIGGFNTFLAQQQADGDDCLLSLVQFDTQDSHEVVADAVPIAEMVPLDGSTFVPRGGTPLYDAIGRVFGDAATRAAKLAAAEQPAEDVVFVIVTDGEENSSCEFGRDAIFDLIKQHEQKGWTFVYLGANQDAYAEGGSIGVAGGSTQAFAATPHGVSTAWASVSRANLDRRGKKRRGEAIDNLDFFGGIKEAEEGDGRA